jgi:hypothetical protein
MQQKYAACSDKATTNVRHLIKLCMSRILIISCFLLLAHTTYASVYISEVAWMGSVTSANHEWIELHNDGTATNVSGWTITDGKNLTILLDGSIAASTYAVLERTSEESAPGDAFGVYTGALVNTGAVLTLSRSDGSIVDRVSGGDDWQSIGGDNTTKQTAQYTSNGWITGDATPGNKNTSDNPEVPIVSGDAEPSSNSSGVAAKSTSSSGETVRLILPDVTLRLAIDAQTVGYVHQPISFTVEPSGIGDTLMDSLEYSWNFGDGMTAQTKETSHMFLFPGTYVVNVHAGFKRQEQVARHEITVLPIAVSLTQNTHGDVQVHNDSQYEIDISGYRLRATDVFIFPERSVVLPMQTITIPKQTIANTNNALVAIYDTEGVMLASHIPDYLPEQSSTQVSKPTPHISAIAYSQPVIDHSDPSFGFTVHESPSVAEETIRSTSSNATDTPVSQFAAVAKTNSEPSVQWTYAALILLLLIGTLGVFIVPRKKEQKEANTPEDTPSLFKK